MTTGIVIMNSTPTETFHKWCDKKEFKRARIDHAYDKFDNDYILLKDYRSATGRQFDKIIIVSDQLFDIYLHLSKESLEAFGKQNVLIILPERYIL